MLFRLEAQPEVIAAKSQSRADAYKFLAGAMADPLRFHVPNGPGERYIKAIIDVTGKSKTPTVLCTYANGVGKTTETLHILANIILGPQNGWYDYPFFHNFPYPKKIWYCSTATALTETIWPMFEDLFNSDLFEGREFDATKEGKPIISKVVFKNGWQIYFKTFNQDAKTYESATVGLVVADEPMPEPLWKAIKSRRRLGCLVLLPMTPLDCDPYILDEIKRAADNDREGYIHISAEVYEACKTRGVRGHLDPDVIDQMVADYDPEEREARAKGRFMYFSGMIYPDLDAAKHYVEPEEYPIPRGAEIFQMVDPHDGRPSAGIWGAVCPNGRRIIFDEYPTDKDRQFWTMKKPADPDDEVKAWADIEAPYYDESAFYTVRRVLDKTFGWQTRGKRTLAELFKDAGEKAGKGFIFEKSYSAPSGEGELAYGHRKVRRYLKPLADGKPGLVIWRTCYHTWQGMTHYIRRNKTLQGDIADADGKIVEKYKDFADCVRFFVCTPSHPVIEMPKTEYERELEEVSIEDDHEVSEYA